VTDIEVNPRVARRRDRIRRIEVLLLLVLMTYLLAAYWLLPAFWSHYEHQEGLAKLPMVTRTAQGIPGDPLNVGLIGDEKDVVCAMHDAGWYPADPITLRSTIAIVGSVLLDRPYRDAPVSSLFYLGRRPDLVFEKPVGSSADRRNHVRFWKVLDSGEEKRPVWLGGATLDRSVGISKYTGAVTHHIAPDLDAERALLAADLESSGMVTAKYQVTGIGPTLDGHNGGGDPYFTDGEIWVLRLVEACRKNDGAVEQLPSPAATEFKDQVWHAVVETIGNRKQEAK
jgi:hypothetical protein